MNPPPCDTPLGFDDLVDYHAGELPPAEEERVEKHYFSCEHCTLRLRQVAALERGLVELVAQGSVRASVTADVVERIARTGVHLRRYVLAPGDSVACTSAPEDDFVVVELQTPGAGALEGGGRIDALVEELASQRTFRSTSLVGFDRARRSTLLLFPGETVRGYPRSRWTLSLTVGGGRSALGPYVMEHTPWHELPPERRE